MPQKGAIVFGHLSESLGRRRSMILAMLLALAMIPAWTFGGSLLTLAIGAFVLQAGVQGAWGIIPAHLSELSPDSVRGFLLHEERQDREIRLLPRAQHHAQANGRAA